MARKKVIFVAFLLFSFLGMFTIFVCNNGFKMNLYEKVPEVSCKQYPPSLMPVAYCQEKPPFLVLLVTSTYHQREVRMAIRNTWGKEKVIHGKRVVTFFLLGSTSTLDTDLLFSEEVDTYRDIIQKDFIDTYYNLTIKTLMGLEWVTLYCPEAHYVMKTDGDMFVNTFYLVELLMRKNKTSDLFTGFLKPNDAPIRNVHSKWYISESEYEGNRYPPFCSGTGYVFSTDVAKKIYNVSSSVSFFKLEDVYVGMCLEKLKIKLTKLHQSQVFFPSKPPFSVCTYRNLVTSHGVQPQQIILYWKALETAENEPC